MLVQLKPFIILVRKNKNIINFIHIIYIVLTLIKSNQYQRVKDFLHKYTIIQPDNCQVFCLMAHILQQTHDTDQAKSWLIIY